MTRASHRPTYTLLDVMIASDTTPMPHVAQVHQVTRMYAGLHAIETAPAPSTDDWRACSDAVNLVETLVTMGIVEDASGLLVDAVAALSMAGKRHLATGAPIRLAGSGIAAVRGVLEDYKSLLAVLPHRTMVMCHRATEARIREIHRGKRRPHDVEVVSL